MLPGIATLWLTLVKPDYEHHAGRTQSGSLWVGPLHVLEMMSPQLIGISKHFIKWSTPKRCARTANFRNTPPDANWEKTHVSGHGEQAPPRLSSTQRDCLELTGAEYHVISIHRTPATKSARLNAFNTPHRIWMCLNFAQRVTMCDTYPQHSWLLSLLSKKNRCWWHMLLSIKPIKDLPLRKEPPTPKMYFYFLRPSCQKYGRSI